MPAVFGDERVELPEATDLGAVLTGPRLRAGVPVKVVSERLGHANPAFTMTLYQHVTPGMQEEAASLFSELVFGPEAQSAATPTP